MRNSDMTIAQRLQRAADLASVPALEELLQEGVDVDTPLEDGLRIYQRAALRGNAEIVRLLYKERPDTFQALPKIDRVILDSRAADLPKVLETGADVNKADEVGLAPLHWSSLLGDTDAVRVLLAAGAEVDARDAWSQTPLFLAIDVRTRPLSADSPAIDREIVESMMAEGLLISDKDTPVEYERIVQLLVANGADVNATSHNLETPLFRAIAGGHRRIFDLITAAGVDITHTDGQGDTALHLAVNVHSGAQKAFVAKLLLLGADPNRKNKNGESAVELARKDGNVEIVRQMEMARH